MQQPYMLIAEDDQDDQFLLNAAFRESRLAVQVHFVQNGKEVLRHLEGISDNSRLPDLIVLDLNMPLLDGRQTLLRLKSCARYNTIPVIILTTSLSEKEKADCLRLGAANFLFKPPGYEKILTTARYLYELSGAAC